MTIPVKGGDRKIPIRTKENLSQKAPGFFWILAGFLEVFVGAAVFLGVLRLLAILAAHPPLTGPLMAGAFAIQIFGVLFMVVGICSLFHGWRLFLIKNAL